jgi:hypothetical protein
MTRGSRHVTELWSMPAGGTLVGASRTVADGKTVEYEFLLIREATTGLEYVARPSGQAEAVFRLVRSSARELVFENPHHDFPTRIIYRGGRNGGLDARIEGSIAGNAKAIDFPYRRASCAGEVKEK